MSIYFPIKGPQLHHRGSVQLVNE